MAGPTREQISVALFNLVSLATGNVIGLVTSDRRARAFTDVLPAEMPALFIEELPEDYEHTFEKMLKLPPKRTMKYIVALYLSDHQESSVVPMTQMNAMIDAIEIALAPSMVTGGQTLGGLVFECRIDGKIDKFENVDNSGKSVALLPIAVLRP
jgi:hypothetical protein